MLEIKLCNDILEKRQLCQAFDISAECEVYAAYERGLRTGFVVFSAAKGTCTVCALDYADICTADGLIRAAAAFAQGKGALHLEFNFQPSCRAYVEKLSELGYNIK
ncbi:MAG TPA: hypothetical protein DCP97_01755, partial [Ruminococcaceae bacterium]|nr:hypothetical protein [Oscillospiraceae bacterium]